ncbi:MAG: hypothetical protein KME30_20990 [Iphinoe sp. HA4291-MV1]|jgi:hemoglobin-like flavoprotein|nr:hypothetical protein [Iphinoe sp. HA4291-MV1]
MSLNFKILQKSFAQIRPYGTKFASRFYYNLFNDYPQLMPLFANTDMEKQDQKLMQTLVLVIYNADNLAHLSSILKDLGERHVRYAVTPEQYPMIGEVLLKTLEEYLGTDWTPEVKQVWTDAYTEIVNLMLEGAKSHKETLKFENKVWSSNNSATADLNSIQPPVTTSRLNDYEDISNPENVSHSISSPNTVNFIPTRPPATKSGTSGLNLKLIPIIFTIAVLSGIGLFYYHFSLTKEKQEITTPKE